ncbi:hypothetical protein GCM10007160_24260 [Litchfieldella qijiaojingensis]|uniref:Photosystem I assembly protein Ycf4 n=1 Tax=Litchfieldella qijiaojingensis TaxID=980347 RepID=A0ABQ2YXK7_9GAMM|nr:hypothetical protein [Halomonas qijiaojingensis]GGX95786.1 hypothetical protein GCM10007160_24260 [Halomonas qijiaojingensis]
MNFLREVLYRPLGWVWITVTGGASVLGVFGLPETIGVFERTLGVIAVSTSLGMIFIAIEAHNFRKRMRAPVGIRSVVNGKHHYTGTMVLILDKSNWLEPGQVIVLVQDSNDVQVPIALVRVETTTTKGFPQAVILSSLSDENLSTYLSDSSRWKSMLALPDIKYSYLNGVMDV